MATLLSYALTTVADVKETLGIASSDLSWDNLITRKINQATMAVENYCGRRFAETTYTNIEYDATLSDQIVLRQRPVTSTTTFLLENRDTSFNSSDWSTIDTQDYFVNEAAGVVNLLYTSTGSWGRSRITYSAGYATIPADLGEAVATLAAYYTLNADTGQIGVVEKSEGSRKLRYGGTEKLSFESILAQLGIDGIIESYSNYPVASGP